MIDKTLIYCEGCCPARQQQMDILVGVKNRIGIAPSIDPFQVLDEDGAAAIVRAAVAEFEHALATIAILEQAVTPPQPRSA